MYPQNDLSRAQSTGYSSSGFNQVPETLPVYGTLASQTIPVGAMSAEMHQMKITAKGGILTHFYSFSWLKVII